MDRLNNDFEALMARYRQAVDGPEPTANFMPRLWQKIEARRTFTFRFRRVTQVFVGSAAVLCLLIAGVSTVAPSKPGPQLHGTYLDALAEAHPAESLAAQGIVHSDLSEASH
jgi:hypothetical protein